MAPVIISTLNVFIRSLGPDLYPHPVSKGTVMAMSREKESLAKVLAHEGGYSNHPADPGGPTMKGVTQRVYDGYRKGKGMDPRPVKGITTDEINAIYDRQYWDAVQADALPDGVDYVLFDGAVNSGPGRSIMWLQQALRPVYTARIDGVLGVGTLAALKAINNNDALIDRICDARMAFLRRLTTFATFGRGWTARVAEVRSIGQAWATGKTPQAADFVAGGQPKAIVEDAQGAVDRAGRSRNRRRRRWRRSGRHVGRTAEPDLALLLFERTDRQGCRGPGSGQRRAGRRRPCL
ncbi:glycoside hydrolase family 108 protein [Mesorhizobium sp. INR15]|uniref:glycoside hydrolase family 108 protein n=1 Tax=Mesorhizobium sp. INR15 TaxID=2654248 RepID=UPI0021560D21|nr:glycoside hydrolase family 108 protein [Mesorhizobium sp. INR15]